ncbi:hypothetical protein Tco_0761758 [Tanacetum coccineum]
MAPMASSDPEVKTCSKTCLKNYESLKKQYDDLVAKQHQTEFKAITYKRGLDTVEAQLVTYRKNEVLFSEEVDVLKREVGIKQYEINMLKTEFEKVKQEKDAIDFKIEKFGKASKDLDQLLGSQITDKSKKGFGYSAVPPPHPLIYNRPNKLDLSYSGLDEFKEPEFKGYGPENSKKESNVVCENESDNSKENSDKSLVEEQVSQVKSSFVEGCGSNTSKSVSEVEPKEVRKNNDAPIIEDWVSDDEEQDESKTKPEKKTVIPTAAKIEKPVKKSVRYAEMYRSQSPRGNQRNWNGQKSNQLEKLYLPSKEKGVLQQIGNHSGTNTYTNKASKATDVTALACHNSNNKNPRIRGCVVQRPSDLELLDLRYRKARKEGEEGREEQLEVVERRCLKGKEQQKNPQRNKKVEKNKSQRKLMKIIKFDYIGNKNLHKGSSGGRHNTYIILGLSVGAAALLIGFIISFLLLCKREKDYKQEGDKDILVYEFMHNGTLKEHLYGPLAKEQIMKWLERLEISDNDAKGRLDIDNGDIQGIIDPSLEDEYDIQSMWKLAEKALMWRLDIDNGDIQGIIDQSLEDEYDIQSMWKLAEKALMCVQPHTNSRPSMYEVIKKIQDAFPSAKIIITSDNY